MKRTLKKILFISLLFSAIMPTRTQANPFNWKKVVIGVIASISAYKLYSILSKKIGLANDLVNTVISDNSEEVKLLLAKGAGGIHHAYNGTRYFHYFDDNSYAVMRTP